ncbi:MAG: flagellar basal-body MS-ring/collar protein FliF, partial [Bryobacteraceae bacterium]
MNQLKKLLASLSVRQRITIVSAAFLIASGLWWFTHSSKEKNFRPLYTSLAVEDAGAVMQKLKEEGVEYRVEENGGTLKVPSERVAELRLRMATAGLPKTGRLGFELFDKTNLGQTEFAEHVNYRRAIEGELERSIMALSEVDRARVHISLPKDSVFLESRQEAKASVMISLRPGAKLSPANG